MKHERHTAIRALLEAGPAASQDELRRRLLRRGFDVTQATLSRDIHDLRLVKGPGGDGIDLTALETVNKNEGWNW